MKVRLELDFNGGGLSGKRGRVAASTASPTFASPSVSEKSGARSGVPRVELGG
jgi:hypothetical protein